MPMYSEKKSKTLCSKVGSTFRNFAVDPVIFLTLLASMIYQLVTQNLYMEKACRVSLNFNETICDAISRRDTSGYSQFEEAEIQKLSSKMLVIKSIIHGLFPSCVSLFAGSWSDRHNKRKVVILTPVVGEFFGCVFLILNVIFFYELPIEFSAISETLPMAMMGGWPCLLLGVYSYMVAAISEENRTMRIGALSAAQSLSILMGMGGSGILYESIGFIPTYVLCAGMIFVAFVYGYFAIKDTAMDEDEHKDCVQGETGAKKGIIMDFFDIRYIVSTFKVCFGSTENNKRYRILAIMIVSSVVFGTMEGENTVNYMYTRYKFGWNAVDYSAFMAIQFIMHIVATVLALAILSKRLHWEDSNLGMISMISGLIGCMIFAFAPSAKLFYVGAVLGGVPSYFAMRAVTSKLVPLHEQGQVNAVLGLCESLSALFCMTCYSLVYKYTVDVFPGTFYLFSGSLKVIGFCAFGYLYMEVKKDMKLVRGSVKANCI